MRMPTRLLPPIVGVALATIAISGCGNSSTQSQTNGGKASAGGTLHLEVGEEPKNLNPTEAYSLGSERVMALINETLFRTSPQVKTEPWLAQSAKATNGEKTWRITLRPNVKFSDGKVLTSGDVVFSIEVLRKSPSFATLFEPIVSVREDGARALVIETKTPMPSLVGDLSFPQAGIVPKNFGGVTAKVFTNQPIGTGPFKLEGPWVPGKPVHLHKNPLYWQAGKPKLDEVVVEGVAESSSRASQLRAGETDVIEAPAFSEIAQIESTPGLRVDTFAEGSTDSLVFNANSPLFRDPRVAEAVSLAIDRSTLVKAAQEGIGKPQGTWFPPTVSYSDPQLLPNRDPAKARSLLIEATAETGAKPSFTLFVPAGESRLATIAQVIEQELDDVGFDVTIQPVDAIALQSEVEAGKFDASFGLHESPIEDPSLLVAFAVGSKVWYTDSPAVGEMSHLLNLATNTLISNEERADLYRRIQKAAIVGGTLVPLVSKPFIYAMSDNVVGFEAGIGGQPALINTGFTG